MKIAKPIDRKKYDVLMYTDGSIRRTMSNGRPHIAGAYATVILNKEDRVIWSVTEAVWDTTISRMEVQAIVAGLQALATPKKVCVVSDSSYALLAIRSCATWARSGWKRYTGEDVANRDLMELLLAETKRHKVTGFWVKGHSGNRYNDLVDKMATEATKEMIASVATGSPIKGWTIIRDFPEGITKEC